MSLNTPWSDQDEIIYQQYKEQIELYLSDKKALWDLWNYMVNQQKIPSKIILKDCLFVREQTRIMWFPLAYDGMIKSTNRFVRDDNEQIYNYMSLMWGLLNMFKEKAQSVMLQKMSIKAQQDIANEFRAKKAQILKSSIPEIREKVRKSLWCCPNRCVNNVIEKFNKYTQTYHQNKYLNYDLEASQSRAFNDIGKEFKPQFNIPEPTKKDVFTMLVCIQEKQNENPQWHQLNLF
jgi:hypothetical protein